MRYLVLLLILVLSSCRSAFLPEPYQTLVEAGRHHDVSALERLYAAGGYISILAANVLANEAALPEMSRAAYAREYALYQDGRMAWRRAAHLLAATGKGEEAVDAYARLMPDKGAIRTLEQYAQGDNPVLAQAARNALFSHAAYRAYLKVASKDSPPTRMARANYRLHRYQEALPYYRTWAATDALGYLGLGWDLYHLGDVTQALVAFARYPSPEGHYAMGYIYEQEGRVASALKMYLSSSAEGIWRATGLLEAQHQLHEALPLYLRLAKGDSSYAEDAAFRAWVLAKRLGDTVPREEAWSLLSGGLGALVGKAVAPDVALPLAPQASVPKVVKLAQKLVGLGERSWAVGALGYALRKQKPSAQKRLAIAQELEALSAYKAGMLAASMLAPTYKTVLELRYPRGYQDWVEKYARANGLDPLLVYSIIWVESRFDSEAVSSTGAKGLMQFVPVTWGDVAKLLGVQPGDPLDPRTSIRYGTRYLRWLGVQCDRELACVITSYNGGIGYTTRGLARAGNLYDFLRFQSREEPRSYLVKVLYTYAVYRALYPES